MKWLFNIESLLPGDILFSRSPGIGKIIAKATKGAYSHVMLYVGDSTIHADRNGVWSKNPQRILVDDPEMLSAFRLRSPLDEQSLRSIESFARTKIGSTYSIPQAILSARKNKLTSTSDEQFCSRLVAQSYSSANFNLVRHVDFCTPNEIARSEILIPVDNCVRLATPGDLEFNNSEDYNLQLQEETYIWLNKVRKLCIRRKIKQISTHNDVGHLLVENRTLDLAVCNYIRATRYLNFADIDRSVNPWRYDVELFLEKIRSTSTPLDVLSREREINESNILRHERDLGAAIENSVLGLEYFKLELDLKYRILSEMYEWRGVMNAVEKRLSHDKPH